MEAVEPLNTIKYYESLLGISIGFDVCAQKTPHYIKYLEGNSPGFKYLGRCDRRVHFKNVKTKPNSTVFSWLHSKDYLNDNYDMKLTHRQCRPTLDSGYVAVQKFSKLPSTIANSEAMQFAQNFLKRMFLPFTSNSKIVHWEDVKSSMNKNAINGYPFSILLSMATKKDFFQLENWVEIVEQLEEVAFNNPDFRVFWQVSQKHEMRANDKLDLEVPKIRVFLAACVDFVVLQNKYCLDFNNRFMLAFNHTFSKVGYSKYHFGWHRIIEYFGEFTKSISVDGQAFDTTIARFLLQWMIELRIESYDLSYDLKLCRKVLNFIYNNISYSMLVLEDGTLVVKTMGNTSGQASTIIDNTGVSVGALAYAYYRHEVANGREPSYSGLLSAIRAVVLGDDSLMGLDPFGDFSFTFLELSNYYSEIGIKLTLEEMEFVPVFDSEFMSTRFLKNENGIYLPFMNRNKMFSSLMAGHSNADPRWVLLRIFAFRTECWADKVMIKMLLKFERFIISRYRTHLVGSIDLKNGEFIKMEDIWTTRLDDVVLDHLYMGFESNKELPFNLEMHKMLVGN